MLVQELGVFFETGCAHITRMILQAWRWRAAAVIMALSGLDAWTISSFGPVMVSTVTT